MRNTKKILAIFITAAMLLTLIPTPVAFAADPSWHWEEFSLTPGGTYYFDMSAQGIRGQVNESLPDTSLKWVPFTYVGTVKAYSLDGSSHEKAQASVDARAFYRTLFVADYNVKTKGAWIEYAQAGLIYGKQYDSRNISYDIRCLSTGNSYVDGQGNPATNEWDQILTKDMGYIKNLGIFSWGQDTATKGKVYRSARGSGSPRSYRYGFYCSCEDTIGLRPALVVTQRKSADQNSLRALTFDMDGNGTLGNKSLTSATVIYNGWYIKTTLPEITEANGFNYTGPGKPGWYYGDIFYEPGTEVDLPTGAVLRAGCKESEQLNLLIGTYYFDLSTQNIPGTRNTAQPDSSLKWVPFTYAGTVNAYSRTSAGASTDQTVSVNKRSLFVADYNVTKAVSWDELNNAGLIFGKAFSKDGVNYHLRSLSAGSNITGAGESLRGLPLTNEWDQILNKDVDYIKNTSDMYSWGQDTNISAAGERYLRGYQSSPRGVWTYPTSAKLDTCGFRPVLEIPDPDALGADGLKTVIFNMGSNGTIGDNKTTTYAKVVYTDNMKLPAITEANGFNYSGPSGTGTLGWYVGSQFYKPGTTSTLAMGTVLTPGYSIAPSVTGPTEMSLGKGYGATSTGGYTIAGTDSVTVSKTSGDAKITWNNSTKKLDIAAGLEAGSYPVTLTASNGISPDTTLNFTLTVVITYTAKVTPTGKNFREAKEGYGEQSAQSFIIWNTGSGTITGLKASMPEGSDFEISDPLNNEIILPGGTATVKVRPKTGLTLNNHKTAPFNSLHNGTFYITGNNGISFTVGMTFYVYPAAPTITGSTEMSLTEGYSATSTGEYAITGTAPVTVIKTSGDAKITWDDTTKKLNIAAGLTTGSYPVVLTAQNGTSPNATLNFMLTVKQDPDIAIVDAAKAAIVDGSVTVASGAIQADKTAAVQSYVNNLIAGDAEGVTATVTYGSGDQYNVALSKGSASDSKSITMTVNEAADPDIATVMAAFNAVNGAPYKNMTTAEAISEEVVANAVKATAETAVNSSGVTVTVTKVWPGYVLPIAGDADNPNGTNGCYGFKVTVSKGSQSLHTGWKYIHIAAAPFIGITNAQAVAAAKAAIVDGSVDVDFGTTQADKTTAVQSYIDDTIKNIADAAGVTATVTHDSGNQYNVALSKGSASDSKSITNTVNEAADPDIATVATAFSLVDGAPYKNMTLAEAISEEVVANAMKATAETAVKNSSVTVVVTKVWPGYVLPTAGDADNPNGTNGRYGFKVTVSKGSQSLNTGWKYIDITAAPFTGITNDQAVAAAKAAIVDGSVNVASGAIQADKTAAVQSYVNKLIAYDAEGVTATVTYGSGDQYNVALSKGSASDSKSITMTVNEAADPDIATVMKAFNAVNGAPYKNMTPEEAVSEEVVADAVRATAVTEVNDSSVTVIVIKVWPGYVLPTAGDADNPDGTNGRYGFKVTVSKGTQSLYTGWKYIDITAAPFTDTTNVQAVAAAKAAIVDGSVDVNFGATQADKTSAVQTYINGIIDNLADAAGVTATVTHDSGDQYNVALSKGSTSDSKSITIKVNEVEPVTVDSVTVKTASTKTTYTTGDTLNLDGLVVTLHNSNSTMEDVAFANFGTKGITTTPTNGTGLSVSDTSVTIIYTADSKSVNQSITVNPAPVVNSATISPTGINYDFNAPADVVTTITWNSASKVTDVVYVTTSLTTPDSYVVTGSALTTPDGYVVTGSALTIKSSYVNTLGISEGDVVTFKISFDKGNFVTLTVNIVDSYTPTANAKLNDLTVNGSLVSGFDPNITMYNVELPYGTTSVLVGAVPNDAHAAVDIMQAQVLPGDATVVVTAEDKITTKSYTIHFAMGAAPTAYQVAVNGSYATASGAGSYYSGDIVIVNAGSRNSYTFSGWTSTDGVTFANANSAITTFTMVAGNVTVTASWNYSGGSGGSSDGGGNVGGNSSTTDDSDSIEVKQETKPNQPTIGSISVKAKKGADNSASAKISEKTVANAIAKAQAAATEQKKTENGIGVSLSVSSPARTKSLGIILTQPVLTQLLKAEVSSFEIDGSLGTLNFDLKAIKEIQKQSTGDVTINITPVTCLNGDAKTLIGSRPVYNISISYVKDGKTMNITSLNNGSVILSISYTPGQNEATAYLFGVYVDGNGNATRIPDSIYDANSGGIIFDSNHFSMYGVGYIVPSAKFTDISTHWARESIDYVVGRGLLVGTSETTFSPDTPMSRGMLVTALGRMDDADVSGYKTSSFTDVKADSTFLPYIEWAYKKGIISGIGNQQFAPDRAVTREEVSMILQNYAKAIGYTLPITREEGTFADSSSISSCFKDAVKAMQQTGIMSGKNNGYFEPKCSVTRAEVSTMLHRYIKLTIDPATAQGW